jgi:hypothetical protein
VHDGTALEERGIPSVAICSDVFFAAGEVQAKSLGYRDFHPTTVEHPIQSLTREEIRSRADGIVEKITSVLTRPSIDVQICYPLIP